MGADEYHPIAHKGSNLTDAGGIGYTVVDSLDTMLLMGLHDYFEQSLPFVASLTFDDVSLARPHLPILLA